jgi:hypothetical protein
MEHNAMNVFTTPNEIKKGHIFASLKKAVQECLPRDCNPIFSEVDLGAGSDNAESTLVVRLNRKCSWKPGELFKKIGATESVQKGNEQIYRGRFDGSDYTLRVISEAQEAKKEGQTNQKSENRRNRMHGAEIVKG